MAIKLVPMGGFSIVPEGWHDFKIIAVDNKEEFGRIEVTLETQDGDTHVERFYLETKSGKFNEGGAKAFSYFVAMAMDKWNLKEIDENKLVGRFISAEVKHSEGAINEKTGKPYINVELGDKKSCEGWGETEVDDEVEDFDLMSLLDS